MCVCVFLGDRGRVCVCVCVFAHINSQAHVYKGASVFARYPTLQLLPSTFLVAAKLMFGCNFLEQKGAGLSFLEEGDWLGR